MNRRTLSPITRSQIGSPIYNMQLLRHICRLKDDVRIRTFDEYPICGSDEEPAHLEQTVQHVQAQVGKDLGVWAGMLWSDAGDPTRTPHLPAALTLML